MDDKPGPSSVFRPPASAPPVCLWDGGICSRSRLPGLAFCPRHAQPIGDLRRCNFVSTLHSRRCLNSVPKSEAGKEGFCPTHARLVSSLKRRAGKRIRYRDTPETIAENLGHYQKFGQNQSRLPKAESAASIPAQSRTRLHRPKLDYYSDASSDEECGEAGIGGLVLDPSLPLPDPDDAEDPLRHAGVLTSEEVVRVARDKLIRLQGMYGDALRILQHNLRLNNLRHRHAIKEEADKYGPVNAKEPKTYAEKREAEAYRALRRYGRRFGRAKLVEERAIRKRREAAGLSVPPLPVRPKCAFGTTEKAETEPVEESEKAETSSTPDPCTSVASPECTEDALPASAYCISHILSQPGQLLFAKCGADECNAAVPPVANLKHCWLHRPIPLHLPWEPAKEVPKSSGEEGVGSGAPPPILSPAISANAPFP